MAYWTVNWLMNTSSAAISRLISAGLVTTCPSARVMDVSTPPAPGVIAVTWILPGNGWVTTTLVRVCPFAGVTVVVRVRP
ncbi:hypothetical protein D3C76_976970 [compost metagenome]